MEEYFFPNEFTENTTTEGLLSFHFSSCQALRVKLIEEIGLIYFSRKNTVEEAIAKFYVVITVGSHLQEVAVLTTLVKKIA